MPPVTPLHFSNPVTLGSLVFATLAYGAFFFGLLAAAAILPGREVEGFPQPSGERKTYKLNGMSLWVGTHMAVITGTIVFGGSLAPLVREFWSFFIVANVFAVAWTAILWRNGRRAIPPQQRGPLTPKNVVAELWYGVELNPTWQGVDLKVFAYQPSLIGLSVLNVAFAYVQVEEYGSLPPQMIAYQCFWWLYMTTHYYYEAGILSMWDIIAEKFGFMLVWGDLVLVPFFYSISAWYLVGAEPMGWAAIVAISILHLVGMWIFRGANAQKDQFKRNPQAPIWGKPPETIGGRLLVSGWWGIGRKLNYTSEIMVYTSFALCTGFCSIVPFLLPLWLCVLFSHRAWRDEQRCRRKYGALWDEYTKRAKFRMIPFVY